MSGYSDRKFQFQLLYYTQANPALIYTVIFTVSVQPTTVGDWEGRLWPHHFIFSFLAVLCTPQTHQLSDLQSWWCFESSSCLVCQAYHSTTTRQRNSPNTTPFARRTQHKTTQHNTRTEPDFNENNVGVGLSQCRHYKHRSHHEPSQYGNVNTRSMNKYNNVTLKENDMIVTDW